MDAAVELSPAAVPLNPQALFTTLHAAASSDQVQLQAAAQQLQTWETQRGYHSLLQVGCYIFLRFLRGPPSLLGSANLIVFCSSDCEYTFFCSLLGCLRGRELAV
jgi:hypothetical protein